MSHFSSANDDNDVLVNEIEILFPEIIEDDKIRTVEFLNAARGIVRIVGMYVFTYIYNQWYITYIKEQKYKIDQIFQKNLAKYLHQLNMILMVTLM